MSQDPIASFIDHMRDVGCGPADGIAIEPDDKWHRYQLYGDKPTVRNGSYKLKIEPDGFAVGVCQSFREGIPHGWHVKATRKASAEDRAAWKAKAEADKRRQAAEAAKVAAEAAERSRGIWAKLKPGQTDYLTRKRLDATVIGTRERAGLCVVPMWSDGKLVGLQFIAPDGSKRFIRGAAKEGAYHAIKGDEAVIVIAEGLATGAAIHAALGCMVVIAFDAGNLKPVAKAIRKRKPEARLVIAADGDQWTIPAHMRPQPWGDPAGDDPRWNEWRDQGLTVNTGRDKALDAAVAIGGAVVVHPPVQSDDPGKRTDFWDVWATDGPEAVKAAFDRAMNPPEPEPVQDWEPDYYHPEPEVPQENPLLAMVRPLGRNGKVFYFFPRSAGQVMDFSGPALANVQNLVTMAPLSTWQTYFGGGDVSEKKMASGAANALIEECNRIGIYSPDMERGVGVWMDQAGPVFNAGDRVYFPGGSCAPADYKSKAVYVQGPRVGRMSDDPLGNAEAGELLSVCLALTWKNRQFGYVLAGWIVAAIIGGALRWRPHIVLTGEKGAGKTWVLENVIKPAIGGLYLERDGGTTEPKIRRDLGGNARPIIMDEAESETSRDRQNMEAIYTLARKASTGAAVGNADGLFYIRSCFCFSAINPRIVQGADLDRNTIIQLVRDRRHDANDRFKELAKRVHSVIGDGFAERLLARCVQVLPSILANIETFSDVIAEREGSKRFGDQFGTLIACAYSLTTGKEVDRAFADDWCSRHDWRWAREDNEQSDSEKLLEYILSSRIRYDDRGMVREGLVGALIDKARRADGLGQDAAIAALGNHAMKVEDDRLLIGGPCQPMADLLRDTTWGGSYRRALGDLDGAERLDKVTFSPTLRVRAVAVPLSLVLAELQPVNPNEEELPF